MGTKTSTSTSAARAAYDDAIDAAETLRVTLESLSRTLRELVGEGQSSDRVTTIHNNILLLQGELSASGETGKSIRFDLLASGA